MKLFLCTLLLLVTVPLAAQTGETPVTPGEKSPGEPTKRQEPSPFRSAVDLQFYNFGNFFQVPDGGDETSVNALGAAYRAMWVRPNNTPDVYGRLSVLRYSGDASETSFAGLLGISKYGSTHWYDIYIDHTRNGYAYDLEEVRASANITSVWGYYSYPIAEDWRVGADTYLDWQRFNVDADLESDYRSLGLQVRYDGFGDLFSPRAGYTRGVRDSADPEDNLGDRSWYIQVATEPTEALEFAVRYRDRTIEFDNIARTDDRKQWLLSAEFKQNERLSWTGWYKIESVDTSRVNRDFDRNTAHLTVSYKF